jgi:hypothetical protein
LPGVISFYLWRHRKELYSTSVYQTIGWLYESYVRGAEFWQVSFGKSLLYITFDLMTLTFISSSLFSCLRRSTTC